MNSLPPITHPDAPEPPLRDGGRTGMPQAGGASKTEISVDIGVDLHEIFKMLRRRLALILACTTFVTAISAAKIFQIVPLYSAESAVMLDARKTQVVDVQAVLSGLPADMAVIHSEVEVLKSPGIAEKVVRKLNLATLGEFNPNLRPPKGFAQMIGLIADRLMGTMPPPSGAAAVEGAPPYEPSRAEILGAMNILRGRTEVANETRSYVLKIRVDSEDPKRAAAIANAYATAYLDSQMEAKFEAVRRANSWLNDHLAEMLTKVEESDRAVQTFKAQHNLTETKGGTLNAQQLGDINTQLMLATAERTQKESNLKQIQEEIQVGGADAAAQVLSSPLIQSLREQETKLLSEEAQLATRYKPAHPAMINLQAEKADLEKKIEEEINKIVRGMTGEVAAARAKENSFRQRLAELQKTVDIQAEDEVQLRQLEREAESNRALYQNFLQRFKQTTAQEDSQQPDARLLAQAQAPSVPSYPHTSKLLVMAMGGSLLLGILAAFIVEQLDPGFRTREQFERLTRVPSLGLIPDQPEAEGSPIATIFKDPASIYSEAIRTLRSALRYTHVDNPPQVVMVTSSVPGEGKSVLSVSLATSVACSGGRALVIDCDLRRPSIAGLLGLEPNASLLALFEKDADFASVIAVDQTTGLHVITSAAGTPNPQDLLGSNHMAALIERLRGEYDLIVLDTPPALSVSDALVLSHLADTTLYLVRWGKSSRPIVANGLKAFRAHGGHLAGAVLTRVDMTRHSTYSYGEDEYIYGRGYATGKAGKS